jgi:hypothetical protein
VYVCNLRPQPPETAGFDGIDHLEAVLHHGVPVDVMVAPVGPTGAVGTGEPVRGVRIVTADVARLDGTGHDAQRLASALEGLT